MPLIAEKVCGILTNLELCFEKNYCDEAGDVLWTKFYYIY